MIVYFFASALLGVFLVRVVYLKKGKEPMVVIKNVGTDKNPHVVIIAKSAEERERAIEKYFGEFPFGGYQTKVLKKYQEGNNFKADITRYGSCD